MGLIITKLSRTGSTETIDVPDSAEIVTFGRSVDCTVDFDPDLVMVSSHHFALRQIAGTGGYEYRISFKKPIFREGRSILNGTELKDGDEITIGAADGPALRFQVKTVPTAGNYPTTRFLKGGRDIASFEQDVRRRFLAGAGIAATLALCLGAAIYYFQGAQASLGSDIAQLFQKADAVIESEKITGSANDVMYLVAIQGPDGSLEGQMTAFAVQGPQGKVLATNAHVVSVRDAVAMRNLFLPDDPAKRYRMVVVPAAKKDEAALKEPLPVASTKIHPGFIKQIELISEEIERRRADVRYAGRRLFADVNLPPAYDVAILTLEDPSKIGAVADIAAQADLDALAGGQPLVMLGFPGENLLGTDARRPVPTSQSGRITSVTGFFKSRDPLQSDQLVQHAIPAVGGSSGSPIFNKDGKVVALLNAGNMVFAPVITMDPITGEPMRDAQGDPVIRAGRLASAALINYAQRADLLNWLLVERSDQETETFLDALGSQFQNYLASFDGTPLQQLVRIQSVLLQRLEKAEKPYEPVLRAAGPTLFSDAIRVKEEVAVPASQALSFTAKPGKTYMLLAASSAREIGYTLSDPLGQQSALLDPADAIIVDRLSLNAAPKERKIALRFLAGKPLPGADSGTPNAVDQFALLEMDSDAYEAIKAEE